MVLVPEIVDAVGVAVIAAGGIADGRGIAAALALGASGVMLGTRFVATKESQAAAFWKQAIVEARGDQTTITDVFSGLYARTIPNAFATGYEASGAPVLPSLLQSSTAQDVYAASAAQGNRDYFPLLAGQSSGLIHDLPGAAEIVRALVAETRSAIAAAAQRAGLELKS
jgi:nitronate monooxygenase